jgi:hypothetical protein
VQNISTTPGFHARKGEGKYKYKIISKRMKFLQTFRKVIQMKIINRKQKQRHGQTYTHVSERYFIQQLEELLTQIFPSHGGQRSARRSSSLRLDWV